MESRSSLFGPSLEPVYYCTSVSVREKPPSQLRSRLHTQSTICSFQYFRSILNPINPIIFISNKSYLGLFGLDSYLEFSSHYIQEEKRLSADPHGHIEP